MLLFIQMLKECHRCHAGRDNLQQVRIPYACKLLFQELMAMNVMPKLIV